MIFTNKASLYASLSVSVLGFVYYWYQMDIAKILFRNKKIKYYSSSPNKSVLTIDDAPYSKDSFESILKILRKHNVFATFFIISSFVNEENREMMKNAVKDGHHLANHGETNTIHYLCNKEQIAEEISHCQKTIDEIYCEANVKQPIQKYYRPGYGLVSNVISEYCEENDYEIVLGNIYPLDPVITSSFINRKYIFKHVEGNDIIILHDRNHTAEMLDELLREMKQMNYNIGTL